MDCDKGDQPSDIPPTRLFIYAPRIICPNFIILIKASGLCIRWSLKLI